jgi:type IV conjugative transfer system protein TraL
LEFKRIPKYIDAPIQFLWWELSELGVIIVFTFGSIILMHQVIWGALAGLIIASKLAKFKEDHLKGLFFHYMYWLGFISTKKTIKAHQKLIIR